MLFNSFAYVIFCQLFLRLIGLLKMNIGGYYYLYPAIFFICVADQSMAY